MDNDIFTLKAEKEIDQQLEELFSKWSVHLSKSLNKKTNEIRKNFVKDGIYPNYTKQKPKILFIGREALGMQKFAEVGYTKTLLGAYNKGKVGTWSLNRYKFHALMFYITYLLMHPEKTYNEIEYATEMAPSFGKKGGISFAFMNLSKFSNENTKDWKLDKPLFDSFVDNSSKFIAKEIEIIDPDIIITMNINDKFDVLGNIEAVDQKEPNVYLYNWKLDTNNQKAIPLADMWHFSAPGKENESNYIEPLLKVLKRNKLIF